MKSSNTHRWVLLGIILGFVIGTVINQAHVEEVRQSVLGSDYTDADIHAHGKELSDTLVATVKGTTIGAALHGISRIFMNLLKMIVIPLVFFSLVTGILGMGAGNNVGRIGFRTALWYASTSIFSILTGLLCVNLIAPGEGTNILIPTTARPATPPESFWDVVANMIPSNVFDSAANFDMFGIIVFAILFGVFLVGIPPEKRAGMTNLMETGCEVMMRMTEFVISFAPVGIAALIAFTVATSGPEVFLSLLPFVLTVATALAIHFLAVLPLLTWLITRRNPYRYMSAMSPAILTAFSTASSAGTLAVTMENAQKNGGISNRISSFVLPLGATVNMDGTALFECVTVLFIAQVHAATHPEFLPLTLTAQITVVFLALAVSVGAAGIPHAGLVMMVIILNAVNLPLEYTALVWAVDRVLDMARTMTNVWSDSCGALVIAHTEDELDPSVLYSS